MTTRVLVIGGYGNFGARISQALAGDPLIRLLVGGRSQERGREFLSSLRAAQEPEAHAIDIRGDVKRALDRIAPDVVIHTSGPFQIQDYRVAVTCIACGVHYVDLADGREFVAGIGALDAAAAERGVLVVSGASSVPCLTAAVIDAYRPGFARLKSIDSGISAAQQTSRGLATTQAVLSYVGRPIPTLRNGRTRVVHGWQGTHVERYPTLGWRLLGNGDVPDLALFPTRYPTLRSIRFAAGHEVAVLHLGTWALSWLVRLRLLASPGQWATTLLRMASAFDRFGSGRSGFHLTMSGEGDDGTQRTRRFVMIARSGHGPHIPCVPAILLARRLAAGSIWQRGAMPCLDLIDLTAYLDALAAWDIDVFADPVDA
jgi:hypothetical protein